MSDSIKEAAERLRYMQYPITDAGVIKQQHDRADLAAAYLAEHPADDDELVTPDWLELVGWEPYPQTRRNMWYSRSVSLLMIHFRDGEGTWLCHGSSSCGWDYVTKQCTRGDLRRLCKLLGIELKE